ncbi:MAG: hypothetical protein ACI86M_001871 [Saprospiraceae bacterium]|jgi:hypothetical protein
MKISERLNLHACLSHDPNDFGLCAKSRNGRGKYGFDTNDIEVLDV